MFIYYYLIIIIICYLLFVCLYVYVVYFLMEIVSEHGWISALRAESDTK